MSENDAPESGAQLMAVSPELQNIEGAWWVRERTDLAAPDAPVIERAVRAAKQIALKVSQTELHWAYLELTEGHDPTAPHSLRKIINIILSEFASGDAVRQARRDDVLGENLRGVLYQAMLGWIEAHPYLKSKLEQGDVGDLTTRLAAALRAKGEKGD